MNFKEATDGLFDRIDHAALAETLGVSVASIRQARLNPKARAYREPPAEWRRAIIKLAEKHQLHYRRLIDQLQKSDND